MMNEESFLKTIAASPDDDDGRLIYATWLEETGDSIRSKYLRVESKMARAGVVAKSDKAEYDERRGCWKELALLRGEIDPAWIDAAGRRYGVVLRSFESDQVRKIIS